MNDLSFDAYLALDALSASGAKDILKCPALYRWKRDNPQPSTATFDFGRAAHALVLGAGDPVEVIDADTWRGKAAQEARDEAVAAGRTPLLVKEWERIEALAAAVKGNPYAANLFRKGDPEVSLEWTDGDTGAPCKGRLDWLTRIQGTLVCVDLKTAASANPNDFRSAARRYQYDLQAAWYLDAIRATFGEDADFLFVVTEKEPPYLTSIVRLSEVDITKAADRARQARETYAHCRKTGEWPGYGIHTIDLPPSYEQEWSE